MREIKFRVWDKVLNKMITQENVIELLDKINSEEWEKGYPYSSDEWYPAYQILGIFDYFNDIQKQGIKRYEPSENRFEIMQYTGLKDKNGKEIYEGDIVKIIVNNNIEKICLVEYKNGIFGVMFSKQAELTAFPHFHNTTFEAIGNIYENPELLED